MKYVKKGFAGYRDASEEYDHVVLTLAEFEQMQRDVKEYKLMASQADQEKRKWQDAASKWEKYAKNLAEQEAIPDGMVAIPEQEYAGFQKALRIIRDRALQQIENSKADAHGYTLMRAEKRKYDQKSKAWLVTKKTPYSLKMSLNEASFLIKKDLQEFYHFRALPVIPEMSYKRGLTAMELLEYHHRFYDNSEDTTSYQDDERDFILHWMDQSAGKVIFEIKGLTSNIAAGVYEVSYWATEPV